MGKFPGLAAAVCSCLWQGAAAASAAVGAQGSIECAVKAVALEQAKAVLGGRHADRIADALSLTGCLPADPMPSPAWRRPRSHLKSAPAALSLHVSAVSGDDDAAGDASSPLRSLHAAQERLRALPLALRAGAEVVLGPGVHFLTKPLQFTPADGGAPGRPVVWRGGGAAVVSGGVPLDCKGRWRRSSGGGVDGVWPPSGTFACDVGANATGGPLRRFSTLFVAGQRQILARYPNGDPLEPSSGYVKGCQTLEVFPNAGVTVLKPNVVVLGRDGKTVVSQIFSAKSAGGLNVTVGDTEKPRTIDQTHENGQVSYRGTRFDESLNLPYWNSTAPRRIKVPDGMAQRWRDASAAQGPRDGSVVKMMHPAGWGSWVFEVSGYDAAEGALDFSRGGWQECQGGDGCSGMYVENVQSELDAPGEWWLDEDASTLYFMPPAAWTEEDLQGAEVVATALQRLIDVRGGGSSEPVLDLTFEDFNVTHAAPTYLEPFESISGGDWAVHRGAAVFVEDAERVAMRRLRFDQLDGNAVFFSNLVRNSSVEDCDFWRTGESALLAIGSVPSGADARVSAGARLPTGNVFMGNWIEGVGVHVKQTSCFCKAMAGGNVLQGNVCYNGPRAGFNWNDGLPGGDLVEHNVVFNMVRETGDHGIFNSWDRKEFIYDCQDGEGVCFTPKTIHLRHNIFVGPAGHNLDHDDASSQYEDFSNVVYLGGIKYRDGVMRNMTGNLLIECVPYFQVIGFDTDFFIDNTIVSATANASQVCGPALLGGFGGTTYATVSDEGRPEAPAAGPQVLAPCPPWIKGPGWGPHRWGGCQCDPGTKVTVSSDGLREMIRATLGGGAPRGGDAREYEPVLV